MPQNDDRLHDLVDMLVTLVRGGKPVREAARQMIQLGVATEVDLRRVQEIYDRRTNRIRVLTEPRSIHRDELEAWYTGPGPDDKYWPSLLNYIEESGWERLTVESIDHASTKIMSYLPPPGAGEFNTRGLVLGYVQSGKTANYTAVIAKAADVNYKLFIILSGLHNNLRSQTQRRLERELVGLNPTDWYTLTTVDQDFKQIGNVTAFLSSTSGQKVLCVVKKNAAVLRKLNNWLSGASIESLRDCPVMIIDDEADQASINTARHLAYRSTINSLIVEILGRLPRSAYIGYTATPFANVLIDPARDEDLYPRDFIVDLPKPDSYFGPEKIFGRELLTPDEREDTADGLDMIRTVDEEEIPLLQPVSRAARTTFHPELTESLRNALSYFWLATAARWHRGDREEHSTMLIHATLYTDVHGRYKTLVELHLAWLKDRLSSNDSSLFNELRELWEREQHRVPSSSVSEIPVPFEDLLPQLRAVCDDIQVIEEHSQSDVRLDYGQEPKTVIVIGGNSLSRGLTLEGLIVSFFIRTASAYDTLLQMGRWFGYRKGYSDLPRIWMTGELEEYFYDLATVEREIRNDIERYEREEITPLDFAVRIRTHPQLSITSRLKMQSSIVCDITYANMRLQTFKFNHRDIDWLQNNLMVTRNLVSQILSEGIVPESTRRGADQLFRQVPAQLISAFISQYKFHEDHVDLNSDLLTNYIQQQNHRDNLLDWNVVIVGQQRSSSSESVDLGLAEQVPMIVRSKLRLAGLETDHANIKALMSTVDRVADLPDLSNEERRKKDAELQRLRNTMLPGTGLLLLYPILKSSQPRGNSQNRVALNAIEHVIGVGLVFPSASGQDTPVQYKSADLSTIEKEEEDWLEDEES